MNLSQDSSFSKARGCCNQPLIRKNRSRIRTSPCPGYNPSVVRQILYHQKKKNKAKKEKVVKTKKTKIATKDDVKVEETEVVVENNEEVETQPEVVEEDNAVEEEAQEEPKTGEVE